MSNLYLALMKINIRPEQAAKAIAAAISCSERTARNKLQAVKINKEIFNNKYEIGFLFKRDDKDVA